ncbi:MAG: S-methyl-5-thioribose-1-phosphate isomerase [Ghiorsea sp.]
MHVNGVLHRAVAWSSAKQPSVVWIDQTKLPFEFALKASQNPEDVARAIEVMEVRGAPTIGATAAYGLALAYVFERKDFEKLWLPRFRQTRPTAVNLFHACAYMENICAGHDVGQTEVVEAAQHYADEEVARNHRIGEHLAEVLAVGQRRIQTHCNAGWLAAVDWGTALSGVYQLAQQGENPSVLVDETRPRLQGAKLTAWELEQEGVACHVQVDSAAAWMMAQGLTDAVVVGADRIANNGDVANKIGTYMLALAAKAHGIPFYVAAPMSTWDHTCAHGKLIPIETRAADEVTHGTSFYEQQRHDFPLMNSQITVQNPAFDVTPFDLITGIITEQGLYTGGIT